MKTLSYRVLFLCLCAVALGTIPLDAQKKTPGKEGKPEAQSSVQPKPAEAPPAEKKEEKKEEKFHGMQYRQVGPFRGGRSLTAVGIPGDPKTYYFGATGGGVWKSTDAGASWSAIFDKEGSGDIGSIAVADSDPNIVYVGTGEACIRGNTSFGDGVYRSLDGGKTWKNAGLKDTQAIGKVIISPTNPDMVFVAALGHPFGPNQERGVFRTVDGGKTWQKVLYKDQDTGAVDITFDPNNPHILFATLWQVRRLPWTLDSGGPGSGIYRSDDDGATWKEVKGGGLPEKPYGRVGITVASNSDRVYALIEAEDGGLYRSDDGGDKWQLVNPDPRLRQRAWYYMHITADPKNKDTVFVMNVDFHKSTDGGRTFNKIDVPHGDNHGLWIDPADTNRMIAVNDGGATVTIDGGKSWTREDNQPTAQFYHVTTDNRFPYYIYGSQQDNTTVAIASMSDDGSIGREDWYPVAGGEAGYIAVDPTNPNIVYGGEYQGNITRFDKSDQQAKEISVYPVVQDAMGAAVQEHRFQWTAPILISPHDHNVVYHGGERLFKSSDGGMHWQAISPDLTRNDKSKQQISGGPITKDDTGTEFYDTIFAVAESPQQAGTIWCGTDDGLMQITRDDGKTWTNITPKDLPEWGTVSQIDLSAFDNGTALVAVDRHRLDDLKPYIFKTTDFGKTWTTLVRGIPEGSFVRAVREDPKKKGLLYAGTETGMYISYNDGGSWNKFQLNLPTVPVHDLVIKGDDLVLATHGRGFWVLDDLAPVRQETGEITRQDFHLYAPSTALHTWARSGKGNAYTGTNPPLGAVFYYWVKDKPKDMSLDVLDSSGKVLRHIASKDIGDLEEPLDPDDEKPKKLLDPKPGLNRFVWDLRRDPIQRMPNYYLFGYQDGTTLPKALPGKYEVRMTADGKTETAPFEIALDPRVKVPMADLQKQYDLVTSIRGEIERVFATERQIHDLRTQIAALQQRLPNTPTLLPVVDSGKNLDAKLVAIEDQLVNWKIKANEDSLQYPVKLDGQLAVLADYVGSGDSAPTQAALDRFQQLKQEVDKEVAAWNSVVSTDLVAFQNTAREHKVDAVVVPQQFESKGGVAGEKK
jgi:photosystem II stability/assembly factor-like uncharacterized protein